MRGYTLPEEYLLCGWQQCDKGTCWLRTAWFTLVGYLVKDLWVCKSLTKWHHVIGILCCLGYAFQEQGASSFVTVCLLLETANYTLNLSEFCGLSRGLAVIAFNTAHALAAGIIYFCLTHPRFHQHTVFVWTTVATTGVFIVMRTRAVLRLPNTRNAINASYHSCLFLLVILENNGGVNIN